jgi:hypothetical protein
MTQKEIRNEEIMRHEEKVDRNIENHQAINLQEKKRGITAVNQNSSVARIVNIVHFAFGALELLLLVRVVLYLLGANQSSGFGGFINALSTPFVALFAGLLQNPGLGATGMLEITTLIAMLVWGIVGWLLGRLIWLVLSRPR